MSDDIRRRLSFYRDIGVKEIYKRKPSGGKPASAGAKAKPVSPAEPTSQRIPVIAKGSSAAAAPSRAPIASTPPSELPSLAPVDDSLFKIQQDIGDCRRCRLCEQRNKIVFGSGNEKASLVFVGE